MPVTARLSKAFYEKLGEDVANELVNWFNAVDATYRSELRDLNELNYARFDAKLEQRIAELRAELHTGLASLRADLTGHTATGLAGVRVDLTREIAAVRADLAATKASLIKWMFVFLSGWAVAVIGVLKYWR